MGIAGNLKTMPLAELLQWAAQGRKTGTIVVSHRSHEKRILFDQGTIVSTSSSDPAEKLGHFLVHHGFLDEPALATVLSEQSSRGLPMGRLLIEQGRLSVEELDNMLRLKAEESIFGLFGWTEGEFRFVDEPVPAGIVPTSIDVTGLVLEAMQRQDEWARLREAIPHRRAIPIATGRLDDDPETGEGDLRLLALVDDRRTVEEIGLRAHASEYHVCRALLRQVQRGRLKVAAPSFVDAAANLPLAVDAAALLRIAQTHLQQEELEKCVRHLRAARSLEPDSRAVSTQADEVEGSLRGALEMSGLITDSVPKLTRRYDEILHVQLSPQEGFVLSRVDGRFDIGSILKITPLPAIESLVVLWKLQREGLLLLAAPSAIASKSVAASKRSAKGQRSA